MNTFRTYAVKWIEKFTFFILKIIPFLFKKRNAFFVLELFILPQLYAQQNPNVYVIKERFIDSITVNDYAQIYYEPARKFTFNDIQSIDFQPYKTFELSRPFLLYQSYNHWIKFGIKNQTSDTLKLLFDYGKYHDIELYQGSQIKKAGLLVDIDKRLFKKNQYLIPVNIVPKTTEVFYARINDKNGIFKENKISLQTYSFEENSRAKSFLENQRNSFFAASFIAIGLFLILFCLIQVFQTQNIAYFFYAMYLLFVELYFVRRIEAQTDFHLLFSYFPKSFYQSEVTLNIFPIICYLLFCQLILDLNENNQPRLYKISRMTILFCGIYWVFDCILQFGFDNYPVSLFIYFWVRILLLIPTIYLITKYFQLNDWVAKYIAIGSYILILAATFSLLMAYFHKLAGSNFFWGPERVPYLEIGIFVENLFFILALVTKIKMIYQERNLALSQLVEQANQQRIIAEFREKLSKAELKSLQSQINPHFIFNSLNSIKSYIQKEKPKDAIKYLTDFANLIRSILQKSENSMISLADEIEILKLYIQLEQMRFENKFIFFYFIDNETDTHDIKIPALLLQPYIENAIWHGLMPKEEKGELIIEIKKQDDSIICAIDDNGIGREKSIFNKNLQTNKHKSLGLQINQERVQVLNELDNYGIAINIIDKKDNRELATGTRVEIRIPM